MHLDDTTIYLVNTTVNHRRSILICSLITNKMFVIRFFLYVNDAIWAKIKVQLSRYTFAVTTIFKSIKNNITSQSDKNKGSTGSYKQDTNFFVKATEMHSNVETTYMCLL